MNISKSAKSSGILLSNSDKSSAPATLISSLLSRTPLNSLSRQPPTRPQAPAPHHPHHLDTLGDLLFQVNRALDNLVHLVDTEVDIREGEGDTQDRDTSKARDQEEDIANKGLGTQL